MTDDETPNPVEHRNGFPPLPKRGGRKITLEDIKRIEAELDDDDAMRAWDPDAWHERNPS